MSEAEAETHMQENKTFWNEPLQRRLICSSTVKLANLKKTKTNLWKLRKGNKHKDDKHKDDTHIPPLIKFWEDAPSHHITEKLFWVVVVVFNRGVCAKDFALPKMIFDAGHPSASDNC